MKKLLKSEICESRVLFTGPTDVLNMVERSNSAATIHEQYPHYLPKRVPKKKKKENATLKTQCSKQCIQTNTKRENLICGLILLKYSDMILSFLA